MREQYLNLPKEFSSEPGATIDGRERDFLDKLGDNTQTTGAS